jgi:carbon monoxide dehydrogenase subunit G
MSFAPVEVLVEGSVDIPLPPEIVWDRLADPVFRSVLMGVERQEIEPAANGRTGEGGMFVCHHGGNRVTPQVIVEWRPFERVVTKDKLPFPGGTTFIHVVYRLEAAAGGTRLSQAFARPSGPAYARLATRLMGSIMRTRIERDLEAFSQTIQGR